MQLNFSMAPTGVRPVIHPSPSTPLQRPRQFFVLGGCVFARKGGNSILEVATIDRSKIRRCFFRLTPRYPRAIASMQCPLPIRMAPPRLGQWSTRSKVFDGDGFPRGLLNVCFRRPRWLNACLFKKHYPLVVFYRYPSSPLAAQMGVRSL